MKILYALLICVSFVCRGQSEIKLPQIISDKNIISQKFEKTSDINLFYHTKVQYLGNPQPSIKLSYTDYNWSNPILMNNYKRPTDNLNRQYKNDYKNIRIFVDTNQTTLLTQTLADLSKITEEEIEAEMDRINNGEKATKEIPNIVTYYDGFPVTIYNAEDKDFIVGFGNHIPLELEALDKENNWKQIYGYRKYLCGTGIKYIMLKPKQIAIVFEPKLNGNFKTKLRYRLKNIVSNEFEGNIDEVYFKN